MYDFFGLGSLMIIGFSRAVGRRVALFFLFLSLIVLVVSIFSDNNESDELIGTIHDPHARALLRAASHHFRGHKKGHFHQAHHPSEFSKKHWNHEQKIARKIKIESTRFFQFLVDS
jgi:hypothetical protein